jgi:hypothetical protein
MVSYVDVDNARLVRNAVHLLALSGYTKIYLLNSSEKLNISCDRTASFLKALTDEKLEGDGSSICYCTESSEEEGAAFAKKVMAEDVALSRRIPGWPRAYMLVLRKWGWGSEKMSVYSPWAARWILRKHHGWPMLPRTTASWLD